MGLFILEDKSLAHVPGTVVLNETESQTDTPQANLKYDRTHGYSNKPRDVPIVLVPQPSDDPNDPLNWSLWKRDLYLLTLSLLSVIASTLSSLLASNTLTISLYFGRTFNEVALLTGYHLLGVGIAGFIFVPSARVWGKRHLYILGTVFLIFSSAWGGATKNCPESTGNFCYNRNNYISLIWARVFQGVGLAPFEALVNASVGDLYFVHQRGARMALTNLALFGGAFCTPVVVGIMTHNMGWEWPFYFVAIFCGALLPVVIFFLPETAYRRDDRLNTDIGMGNGQTAGSSIIDTRAYDRPSNGERVSEADVEKKNGRPAENEVTTKDGTQNVRNPNTPGHVNYWKTLAPLNGRKTDEGYFNLLLRPFPLFLHPGVLWACLTQGVMIGWTVMIGVVLAAIMLGPPLFFQEFETGYLYAGAFLGAVIGFLISGLLADYTAKLMTKWNDGVYEPEFRMLLVIPQALLGVTGLFAFGWVSNDIYRYHWAPSAVFFGFQVAGMVIGAVSSALYIVDAHRDIAVEAFTCLLVFKNIFSYSLTYRAYDWVIVQSTPWGLFKIVGGVQIAVCALTIPMYVFGKKNRSFFARHPIFFQISDAIADAPKKLVGRFLRK